MRVALILHLSVVATWAPGCGPSIRRVHLADEYFERCYAGDRDPAYTDPERLRCWDRWLAFHTVGQSDERIGHARERLLQLNPERSMAVEMATGEMEMAEMEEAARVEVHEAPVVALTAAATGAEVTFEPETTPEERARHRPTRPRTATTHCDGSCLPPWESCVDACAPRDEGCVDACRSRFRTCAAACY